MPASECLPLACVPTYVRVPASVCVPPAAGWMAPEVRLLCQGAKRSGGCQGRPHIDLAALSSPMRSRPCLSPLGHRAAPADW
jgi:hypothetical protein